MSHRRINFCTLLLLAAVYLPTELAGAAGPAAGGDAGQAAPPPARPAALDAAYGTAPAGRRVDPTTTDHAGFAERGRTRAADQAYGSSAQTVAPDGTVTDGLQVYDESLLPGEPGYSDDIPDYYVVRSGDTLWDISAYYMHDPYQWPQLWSWNEHVTNAHWIFPGDRIRLYDPIRGRGRGTGDEPQLSFSKTKLPVGTPSTYVLNQIAFVEAKEFETSMKVIGGGEAKVMMATLDTVYMDYEKGSPPVPGERLIAYAPRETVYDLKNRKKLGYVVQIMGEIDVESVAREASEGTVAHALNPIERGYRVGPLRRRFRRVDQRQSQRCASGLVVSTLTSVGPIPIKGSRRKRGQFGDYVLAGEEQFVVTDLGRGSGIEAGHVLEVVRKGDEYTKKRVYQIPYEEGWPRRVIGALLVVQVDADTSLAVAIYSRREFERGDHVELGCPAMDPVEGTEGPRGKQRGGAEGEASVEREGGKAKGSGSFKLGG